MLFGRTFVLLLSIGSGLLAAERSAFAGDPCPIGFTLLNLGLPPWAEPALKAKYEKGDPFFERLIEIARKQECTDITGFEGLEERLPIEVHEGSKVDLRLESIRGKLFAANRGFRCDDAAKALKNLDEAARTGAVLLYLRGHNRIILVLAGWSTLCVGAAEADAMTEKAALAVWEKVTKKYVRDRHENP